NEKRTTIVSKIKPLRIAIKKNKTNMAIVVFKRKTLLFMMLCIVPIAIINGYLVWVVLAGKSLTA
ncbi:MAG: hypothetical protein WAM22_03225, partial [Nitrososphaeraceae archaeon]